MPAVLGSGCYSIDQGGASAGAGLALLTNPELVHRQYSPEYAAFVDFAWLKTNNLQVAKELRDQQLPAKFKASVFEPGLLSMRVGEKVANLRPQVKSDKINGDRMEVQADVLISVYKLEDGNATHKYSLEAVLVLESAPGRGL